MPDSTAPLTIIGIDYATNPRKVGLARAQLGHGLATLLDARVGHPDLLECVAGWLGDTDRALLAIDSPLGWPMLLSATLSDHEAGQPLAQSAHRMFRRATDDKVHELIGRRPLDIGADRIARTAHSALSFLHDLRGATGQDIPMAWSAEPSESVAIIEVYPAATLVAHGLPSARYKRREQRSLRASILEGIVGSLSVDAESEPVVENADILDAVVCVLAGLDFLAGRCRHPTDDEEHFACKEGWIWVRKDGFRSPAR